MTNYDLFEAIKEWIEKISGWILMVMVTLMFLAILIGGLVWVSSLSPEELTKFIIMSS
jgi:hypothetical protein